MNLNDYKYRITSCRLLIIVSLLFLMVIFSCGTKDNISKYGGEIRTYISSEPRTLDPLESWDVHSGLIVSQVFEGLFSYNLETMQLEKRLVEHFEIFNNGRKFLLRLKEAIYFQDDPCFPQGKGRELTAADVIYSWNRKNTSGQNFLDFMSGRVFLGDSAPLISVTKKSRYEIIVELSRPRYSMLFTLTRTLGFIVPQEAVEAYGLSFKEHPVGTGAFRLIRWEPNHDLELIGNRNYWRRDDQGEKLPYINGLIFRNLPEELIRFREFQSGLLDLTTIPSQLMSGGNMDSLFVVPEAWKKYGYRIYKNKHGWRTNFIMMPSRVDPVFPPASQAGFILADNQILRQALNYAIDRNEIVQKCFPYLQAHVAFSFIPSDFSGFLKIYPGYGYNEKKSHDLLKNAGYPAGKGLPVLNLLVPSGLKNEIPARIAAKSLNRIGVRTHLLVAPYGDLESIRRRENVELIFNGWIADYPDAMTFIESAAEPIGPIDSLTDSDSRKAAVLEWEKNYLDQARRIFLYHLTGPYYLTHSYVKGYFPNPMNSDDYSEVWIDKAQFSSKK